MWSKFLRALVRSPARSARTGRRGARSVYEPLLESLECRLAPATATSIFLDLDAASPIVQASPTSTVKVFIDASALGGGAGGISSAQFYVKYDPAVLGINELTVAPGTAGSDIKFGPLFTGLAPSLAADYSLGVASGATSGLVGVFIIDTAGAFYTGTAGGQMVELDFHVLQSAPVHVSTLLDLSPNSGSIKNATYIADVTSGNYPLNPSVKSYSGNLTQPGVLAPGAFSPVDSDTGDAAIQVAMGGPAVAPTVVNDSYIMAAPTAANGFPATMTITGAANGVLGNDIDSNGSMDAILAGTYTTGSTTINGVYSPTFTQATAHGGVTLDELDGSFSYTPNAGYVGLDSFSYMAIDALSGTPSARSATVTIQVGSTVSIPKSLALALPDTTVVVPVMIDDPDPIGSGGVAAVTIGINYDATKFTVSNTDVAMGTLPAAAGWTQLAATTTPGQVVIVESGTPITTTAPGSLAFITLHTISGLGTGTSVVNLSAAVPAVTGLLGAQSGDPALALYPAPVDNPTLALPGSADDGLITITAGTATTTTVGTSSATPTYGTPVTLSATVTATSGTAAPTLGSVQFFLTNNSVTTPLGGAISTDATSGSSAIFTLVTGPTTLQAGLVHAISATYTPGANFNSSSSTNAVSETVAPLALTVTGITANNKVYDATTKATLNTASAGLAGVITGDVVTLSTAGATGTFASKNAGNNVAAAVSGLSITGAQAADYALTQPAAIANISPAPLTLTAVTNTKTYDGTVSAAASPTVVGILGSDTITGLVETYDTPNVGSGKTLSVSPSYTINDGNAGNNYAVTAAASATGAIVPGPFAKFVLTVVGGDTIVAGSAFILRAQATDIFGNPVSSYTGPTSISASTSPVDPQGTFPLSAQVDSSGLAFSQGILQTAGPYTLTAGGASVNVTVGSANASYFVVTPPTPDLATTGSAFNITVAAFDHYGNPASGYAGTVSITSTDPLAPVLVSHYTFVPAADSGVHIFSVTLNSSTLGSAAGTTIIVKDVNATAPPVTGFSAVGVQGLVVVPGGFQPTATGFTVTFSKPFTPADLTEYGSNLTTAQDVTLVGANGGPLPGSLYLDPTTPNTLVFKASSAYLLALNASNNDVSAALPDDTYTVTLVSGTGNNGFVDALNTHLDGFDNGTAANYTTTFTTTYQDDAHKNAHPTPILAVPDFARGPDSADVIQVPNNSAQGIPVTLYNVTGSLTDASFTLTYNPQILTPTGGGTGDAAAGSTFTIGTVTSIDSTHSSVPFTYHNVTGQTGTVVLGDILATVPNSAASIYKTKELLALSNISITGGATVLPSDGIHVDAYSGDVHVTASPAIDASDALDAEKVASGAWTGFPAYTLLDPAIIGGFIPSHTISVDAADVTALFTKAAHGSVPALPNVPSSVTTVSVGGADPTMSLGGLGATNGIVNVPVMLDDPDPLGSTGMTEAHLVLTYDAKAVSVAPSDVTLGSIPNLGTGWQISSVVDAATGQLVINLFNLARTPITSTQAGSLVDIAFHVVPGAVPGTPVQLVNQATVNGQRYVTDVDDDQGPLTLSFASDTSPLTWLVSSQTAVRTWPGLRYSEAPAESDITARSESTPAVENTPSAGASENVNPGHEYLALTQEYLALTEEATGLEMNGALVCTNPGAAGQVFQLGVAPALNSLLNGNSPGQLAADWLFLALARGMEISADTLVDNYHQTVENIADTTLTVDQVFAHLADEDC